MGNQLPNFSALTLSLLTVPNPKCSQFSKVQTGKPVSVKCDHFFFVVAVNQR